MSRSIDLQIVGKGGSPRPVRIDLQYILRTSVPEPELEPVEPKLWSESEPEPKINNFGSATLLRTIMKWMFLYPPLTSSVLSYIWPVLTFLATILSYICHVLHLSCPASDLTIIGNRVYNTNFFLKVEDFIYKALIARCPRLNSIDDMGLYQRKNTRKLLSVLGTCATFYATAPLARTEKGGAGCGGAKVKNNGAVAESHK